MHRSPADNRSSQWRVNRADRVGYGQIFPALKTTKAEKSVPVPRVPQHTQAILLGHYDERIFAAVTGPTHSIGERVD
ncbi:MAG: hypothetical protein ACE1ZF_06970 [Gemmatimonadales bacterium]|jgi:hypothetical protein